MRHHDPSQKDLRVGESQTGAETVSCAGTQASISLTTTNTVGVDAQPQPPHQQQQEKVAAVDDDDAGAVDGTCSMRRITSRQMPKTRSVCGARAVYFC